MHFLTQLYQALVAVGKFLKSFFLLAVRLFFGWQFFQAGLEKFGNIGEIAQFFETLGFNPPLLHAYLAASTELVCGLLLVIGLASRLAAIPLIVTMIVALSTAHYEVTSQLLQDPVAFVSQAAFIFLFASLTIFVFGPGKFSIDAIIKRSIAKDI